MKTIMIVDDEKDIRDSMEGLLEKNGYRVLTAENGDDCLRKVEKDKPDLILLDVMMPGTPVQEVVRRLKGTKIVIFTVVRMNDTEKEQLFSDRIVGFIEKPVDIRTILSKIKHLVG